MKNKLIEEIKNNNLTIVNTLLANGANINYQDKDGYTALMGAVIKNNLEVVQGRY